MSDYYTYYEEVFEREENDDDQGAKVGEIWFVCFSGAEYQQVDNEAEADKLCADLNAGTVTWQQIRGDDA